VRLIALDIDGTLLDSAGSCPRPIAPQLLKALRRGIEVALGHRATL